MSYWIDLVVINFVAGIAFLGGLLITFFPKAVGAFLMADEASTHFLPLLRVVVIIGSVAAFSKNRDCLKSSREIERQAEQQCCQTAKNPNKERSQDS